MTAESQYIEALREVRAQAEALVETMSDPFKAPELAFGHFPAMNQAMWQASVEYAAMTRKVTA